MDGFGTLGQIVPTLPLLLRFPALVGELLMDLLLCLYGHALRLGYQHVVGNAASAAVEQVGIECAIKLVLVGVCDAGHSYVVCIEILLSYEVHVSHLGLTVLIDAKRLK